MVLIFAVLVLVINLITDILYSFLIFAVPEGDPCGGMHVGSVYQNVGLFCASAGLANVVKASTTRDQGMFPFLPEGWKAQATQSVGRPR